MEHISDTITSSSAWCKISGSIHLLISPSHLEYSPFHLLARIHNRAGVDPIRVNASDHKH